MAAIFNSPSKYIQGPDELAKLGSYVEPLGAKALVIVTPSGKKRVGAKIEGGFAEAKAELLFEDFNGECSKGEVDRLVALARDNGCDIIVGVGGGKILDTAKAVAYYLESPVIICPTIASTDAPCSALSVLYTDDGQFDKYLFLKANPNIVLMDTTVIAASPVRLTVSGMGDALGTYFEGRASIRTESASLEGTGITRAGQALARLCYDTLREYGKQAIEACKVHAVTPALENIVEANVYLSGVGADNVNCAAAHSFYNGVTSLGIKHADHGCCVALGTLVQLVLEGAPKEEFKEVQDFCLEVGLPVTLEEIGVTTPEQVKTISENACIPGETIHNLAGDVQPVELYDAIMQADAMGKIALGK